MRAAIILLILGVGVGCAVYKPVRVIAPQMFGLTCFEGDICVADVTKEAEARALYDEALVFVESNIGDIEALPPGLFCSTVVCFSKFADPQVAAVNVGTFGILMNAHGWQPHIVRHELIHHWQNEQFGRRAVALSLPRWYIEGMAYTLSEDPRDPLPRDDIQAWRQDFRDWVAAGNDWRQPPE